MRIDPDSKRFVVSEIDQDPKMPVMKVMQYPQDFSARMADYPDVHLDAASVSKDPVSVIKSVLEATRLLALSDAQKPESSAVVHVGKPYAIARLSSSETKWIQGEALCVKTMQTKEGILTWPRSAGNTGRK